jgi:hypothetical protein
LGVELCDQSHNLTLRSCFAILSSLFFGAGGVKELKEEFGIFSREKKRKNNHKQRQDEGFDFGGRIWDQAQTSHSQCTQAFGGLCKQANDSSPGTYYKCLLLIIPSLAWLYVEHFPILLCEPVTGGKDLGQHHCN